MANKEPKVKVQNLTKRFGDLLVLDNLNFEVEEGESSCASSVRPAAAKLLF